MSAGSTIEPADREMSKLARTHRSRKRRHYEKTLRERCRWKFKADSLVEDIAVLKTKPLTDIEAKALICDAFTQGIMPNRFLGDVVNEYLKPRHEEFAPRTAWSLSNAFTEVQKQMPLTSRMVASQDLGRFFKLAA